jgi:sialate O-acetylesterase
MTKRLNVLIVLLVFILYPSGAEVRLPALIGSGMVLQQKSTVTLWGWAEPGEEISVSSSWGQDTFHTKANDWARWSISFPTPAADNTPHTITISGNNTIVLRNVLLGEVWLCSGQSNMEWNALSGFNNSEEEVMQAVYPKIRFFSVEKAASDFPQYDCRGSWSECSPASMRTFSATGYFFGRELHRVLNVPVGLINSSWGGTFAEVWTKSELVTSNPELFESYKRQEETDSNPMKPGVLFNAMIAPLIPYQIAGVIWYQGESNVVAPQTYPKLFHTMISQWRNEWKKELPFYYVQIAPYDGYDPFRGVALRDAQRQCMSIPNVGMIVTSDIGNIHDIHPGNKQDVGKRLAGWALAKTYGKTDITFSGPMYKSMKIEGSKIRLSFTYADHGLMAKGGELTHFEIADQPRKFSDARVVIDGNDVLVWNERVKNPTAVRFAWSNTAEPNLYNKEGLPASAFRTDDWEIIYDRVMVKPVVDFTKNAVFLTLSCSDSSLEIRYMLDGTTPAQLSEVYRNPLMIRESITLCASAFHNENSGPPVTWTYTRHKGWGKSVTIHEPYQTRYATESKDRTVVDGLRGTDSFRDGMWQGYEGNDVNITIDLGETQKISRLTASFYQDQGSWIFLPSSVFFSVSDDDKNYRSLAEIKNNVPQNIPGAVTKEFSEKVNATARYINVKAKNIAVMPDWHEGRGGKAWIFIDEIVVE